ncbi:MAG: tetratricopeptide repeat protein [Alphaproteobacteria bacterium]|nr:tetratricopeptide repeat protein [Alphaproteobacteria bacterium]
MTMPPGSHAPDPATEADLLHQAETALVEGRPETTLEICRQVLSHVPDHADAMFLEAEALRDLRDAEEAEEVYRRVVQLDPAHSEAWSGLGTVMFEQGRLDEAGRCHARALRLRDDNADAYYGRAMLRERRGDVLGAHRDYVRAWRLSERYPLPRALDDDAVRALLHEAATEAGGSVAAWIDATPVVILELPELETCEAYEPPASPAELLGHVSYPSPPELSPAGAMSGFPPAILLYRQNLERYADDRPQLVHALRESVVAHVEEWLAASAIGE